MTDKGGISRRQLLGTIGAGLAVVGGAAVAGYAVAPGVTSLLRALPRPAGSTRFGVTAKRESSRLRRIGCTSPRST